MDIITIVCFLLLPIIKQLQGLKNTEVGNAVNHYKTGRYVDITKLSMFRLTNTR
jgi:hypothetical protein